MQHKLDALNFAYYLLNLHFHGSFFTPGEFPLPRATQAN